MCHGIFSNVKLGSKKAELCWIRRTSLWCFLHQGSRHSVFRDVQRHFCRHCWQKVCSVRGKETWSSASPKSEPSGRTKSWVFVHRVAFYFHIDSARRFQSTNSRNVIGPNKDKWLKTWDDSASASCEVFISTNNLFGAVGQIRFRGFGGFKLDGDLMLNLVPASGDTSGHHWWLLSSLSI